MVQIQAIATPYDGYIFRSRLEARWAVFLNAQSIAWQYEVEGYRLANGLGYLPDFVIAQRRGPDAFLEIKPDFDSEPVQRDLETIRLKAKLLALGSGKTVYIVYGPPWAFYAEQHRGGTYRNVRRLFRDTWRSWLNYDDACKSAKQERFGT